MAVRAWLANFILRNPAKRRTLSQQLAALTTADKQMQHRLAKAAANEGNKEVVRHIIGIERWGQRRLRTFLGDPPGNDEYDPYRPHTDLDWLALCAELHQTRQQTIALGQQIRERHIGDEVVVNHNNSGPMTAREWLYYLGYHGRLEMLRIRY